MNKNKFRTKENDELVVPERSLEVWLDVNLSRYRAKTHRRIPVLHDSYSDSMPRAIGELKVRILAFHMVVL